jgi:hypothetical protein
MNLPVPWEWLLGPARRTYGYFRTGVKVEGKATLCEDGHNPVLVVFDNVDPALSTKSRPQHIDVEVEFWNRRDSRISILDVAEAKIVSREQALSVAPWFTFSRVTLEGGDQPQKVPFVLVPAGDPDARVEVGVGEVLVVDFLPSRGSERFARPRLRVRLGLQEPS